MAKFNSPTSIFNHELSIFNREFLKASSSLSFDISSVPSHTEYIYATSSFDFSVNPKINVMAYLKSQPELFFNNISVMSATAELLSEGNLKFLAGGELEGFFIIYASSSLDFKSDPILNARAYTSSVVEVNFDLPNERLDAYAGRTSLMSSSLEFDTSLKLRVSPWQGISQIGNAVYRDGVFSSNYNKSPFGKEVGL